MLELSEQNVTTYLRDTNRISPHGEILVQSLSGGIANVVLKIFDTAAGEKIGTDTRSPAQKKLGKPDTRMNEGACFVIKQPLPKFRTEAEWLVDVERVLVERDCMTLLENLLPAGSTPRVLWYDDANRVLAMSCAPTGAVIWKKALLAGEVSMDAATHAGMLLAMLHSPTVDDAAIATRYGDPKLFTQQRIDPYLRASAEKHPAVAATLNGICRTLLEAKLCLIHGDFSPKNIFLIPAAPDQTEPPMPRTSKAMPVSQLMLLDFEVAYYGHPAFDVATLINHLLLKGFHHGKSWRPFMLMADNFWQTYRQTAGPELVSAAESFAGRVLGGLLLARIDGKSPVEYLADREDIRDRARTAALKILQLPDASLECALDEASMHFEEPA